MREEERPPPDPSCCLIIVMDGRSMNEYERDDGGMNEFTAAVEL